MNTNLTRHSFQKDLLGKGLSLPLEVKKSEDGTYVAKVIGQDQLSANGPSESQAVNTLRQLIRDTFTKDGGSGVQQSMVG